MTGITNYHYNVNNFRHLYYKVKYIGVTIIIIIIYENLISSKIRDIKTLWIRIYLISKLTSLDILVFYKDIFKLKFCIL